MNRITCRKNPSKMMVTLEVRNLRQESRINTAKTESFFQSDSRVINTKIATAMGNTTGKTIIQFMIFSGN